MHFWPKFGNTDFNWWWLFARTSSKWGKFWLLSSIWPWSSRSIVPQNNRDLNQGLFHLWSKFGDSSLNGWWVIARTSWWLTDRHTHTHTHTHAGNDNTRRPKLASGKNQLFPGQKWFYIFEIHIAILLLCWFSLKSKEPKQKSKQNLWKRVIKLNVIFHEVLRDITECHGEGSDKAHWYMLSASFPREVDQLLQRLRPHQQHLRAWMHILERVTHHLGSWGYGSCSTKYNLNWQYTQHCTCSVELWCLIC